MSGRFPIFPKYLEALIPIIDGWTPITAEDINLHQGLIRRIEDVLGWGINGLSQVGPKGGNADVTARINAFLEEDGRLHDIDFLTGTRRLGDFSENNPSGAVFTFSKTMSTGSWGDTSYHVLADFSTPDTSSGVWIPGPACWWTVTQASTLVTVRARDSGGLVISANDDTQVRYSMLVIGYEAYVM